jgi:hypothetical protein
VALGVEGAKRLLYGSHLWVNVEFVLGEFFDVFIYTISDSYVTGYLY